MEHRKGSEVPDTLDTNFQIKQSVISNIIYGISSLEFHETDNFYNLPEKRGLFL